MTNESTKEKELNKEDRRGFFRLMLGAGIAVALAALASFARFIAYVPPPTTGGKPVATSWPRVKLINAKSLESLKPVRFNYPLVDTPNLLVKLGVKAEYGLGPDGDIVAFSDICQHLGCFYGFQPPGSSPSCNRSYKATVPEGYCCCHGSYYDFTQDAKVIGGPAPRPVPRVIMEYDASTRDIYAVGMAPPTIFGHGPPGTTDPSLVLKYDLEGGEVVTQSTVFSG
jgi:arsenite oxidase small subunit